MTRRRRILQPVDSEWTQGGAEDGDEVWVPFSTEITKQWDEKPIQMKRRTLTGMLNEKVGHQEATSRMSKKLLEAEVRFLRYFHISVPTNVVDSRNSQDLSTASAKGLIA